MKITKEMKDAVENLIEVHYDAFTPDRVGTVTSLIRVMDSSDFNQEMKENIAIIMERMADLLLTDMNILEELIHYEDESQ